jgi:hypothetical protein
VISPPAAGVEKQYDLAGLRVAVMVMFGWPVIATLPGVVYCWMHYGLVASGVLIWLAYMVTGAVSAWTVLRGGGQGAALGWAVCPVLLAGVVIVALESPEGFFGHYNWAFTISGWFALVALWRRTLPELLAFFAANFAAGLAALIWLGETGRLSIARFIVECAGISVLQVTIFVGGRAVAGLARGRAEAEDALARTRIVLLASEAAQATRRINYEMIKTTIAGLLDDLAAGTLAIADPDTRRQVRVAVGRLRRYTVETDELPDQLSHELHACADQAERDGVAVDLIAPAGAVPPLPVGVRRALTDPVIRVLGAAATQARITVVTTAASVIVAVIADALVPERLQATRDDVTVAQETEGERLWVQASWTGGLLSSAQRAGDPARRPAV